jgi:hypothetical protein
MYYIHSFVILDKNADIFIQIIRKTLLLDSSFHIEGMAKHYAMKTYGGVEV